MSYTLDMTGFGSPEEMKVGSSNFVITAGRYHLGVQAAVDSPADSNGNLIDGLKVVFEVLAGTDPEMIGRTTEVMFWHPKPTDKDGGTRRRAMLGWLALSSGLITPADCGKPVDLDWSDLENRQLIAGIKIWKNAKNYENNEIDVVSEGEFKGRPQLFALSDPLVADVPKDEEAIALLAEDESTGDETTAAAATTQTATTAPSTAPVAKKAFSKL